MLDSDFNTIRAGHANPRVLDQITVGYYGVDTPINQVANIQVADARMIMITPWDPSMLKDLERAIQMSDLGINPQNDGKALRLIFPQLTEERRRELTRDVSRIGEDSRSLSAIFVETQSIRSVNTSKIRGSPRMRCIRSKTPFRS